MSRNNNMYNYNYNYQTNNNDLIIEPVLNTNYYNYQEYQRHINQDNNSQISNCYKNIIETPDFPQLYRDIHTTLWFHSYSLYKNHYKYFLQLQKFRIIIVLLIFLITGNVFTYFYLYDDISDKTNTETFIEQVNLYLSIVFSTSLILTTYFYYKFFNKFYKTKHNGQYIKNIYYNIKLNSNYGLAITLKYTLLNLHHCLLVYQDTYRNILYFITKEKGSKGSYKKLILQNDNIVIENLDVSSFDVDNNYVIIPV